MRLRDLAGLIVIDFIDMDESKNNRAVEKALKDALAKDRARIQMGRISDFGLMEISRQRRRLGVIEGATEVCPHCEGAGRVRSAESAALMMLRAVDIEAGRNGAGTVGVKVPLAVALYMLNHKRAYLDNLARTRGVLVMVSVDESLSQGDYAIERLTTDPDFVAPEAEALPVDDLPVDDFVDDDIDDEDEDDGEEDDAADLQSEDEDDDRGGARRGRGRGRPRAPTPGPVEDDGDGDEGGRRRRRGRRGGRRVREDAERDGFVWVRGRTPSLADPYVWFDPINPQAESDSDDAGSRAERSDRPDAVAATDEVDGDREGGRRRRRRRGRGRDRDRSGSDSASPRADTPAEARAANEGMIDEAPVDTAVAAPVDTETSVPVTGAADAVPAPKRRRVRRKATAETTDEQAPAEAPIEVEAETTVPPTPAEPEAAVEPEPVVEKAPQEVVVSKPTPPRKTVDVEEILASDPNQITAPPPKPKRGWWRL